ncbi:MAG: hypothetical protein ISS70_20875 [Phycisphaerae bacterium]|nr:hypothetical protein [Phycisphaerae bacterium]
MSRLYPKQLKTLAALFLLSCVCGCTTVESRLEPDNPYAYDPSLGLEKEDILAHFNLHRGRWWNYYARGSWLLAWGHHCAALKDFKVALNKRDRDKRDARTYGMHFMDYFPQREYGIASCLRGEHETDSAEKKRLFSEAMDRLRISIGQETSSKAKFYLKRATAGFWGVSQADSEPPVVWIENNLIDRWADVPTLYINGYAATLRIRASDDQSHVGTVWVDGKRLFVESAEEDFNDVTVVTIDASDKERTVAVEAMDLAGNKSWPATIKLIVDTAPPTAAIKVQAEEATFADNRIPVQVFAMDDRGLKSVRVGDDPHDNRDCRGKLTWDGKFYVESRTRDLDIEITDRAGNVTAMSVTLDPERAVTDIGRGERLPAYYSSLGHGRSLGRVPFDAGRRGSGSIFSRLARFSAVETHSLSSQLGPIALPRLASHQDGPPRPILVFPDFKDNSTVETLHRKYNLKGHVVHADGLQWIKINGKVVQQEDPSNEGNFWVFSYLVQFADHDSTLSIRVEARCKDGTYLPEHKLKVKKVGHCLWEPQSKYSVTLLPLEQKYAPADAYLEHMHREAAHNIVLNAVRSYTERDPNDNEDYQRFDCHDLVGWDAADIEKKVKYKVTGRRMTPNGHGQIASDFAKDRRTDLAIYGSIKDDPNEFEVTLRFTAAESYGKPLFDEVIDVFDKREYPDDPNHRHHVEALISKLDDCMRRIRGKVVKPPQDGTIVIDCGTEKNVFDNLNLLLYDEFGSQLNKTCEVKCRANVTKLRMEDSDAQIETCDWGHVVGNWEEIRVIGK